MIGAAARGVYAASTHKLKAGPEYFVRRTTQDVEAG